MASLDNYFVLMERLTAYALDRDVSALSLMDMPPDDVRSDVQNVVEIRSSVTTPAEMDYVAGYFSLGFLDRFSGRDRAAAFLCLFELNGKLALARLLKSCKAYEPGQPLFKVAPELWDSRYPQGNKPSELILCKGLKWDASSQLVILGESKARIDGHLRQQLLAWLRETFSEDKLYLRIHPFDVGSNVLPLLQEVAVRPSDPTWWKSLNIWPGQRKPAVYELEECSPRQDCKRYWEREVGKLGKLEVAFRRDNDGCISAMIEELPRLSGGSYIIGYCLHLTSESSLAGTSWDAATVAHIDGAINVYCDGQENKRLLTSLADGIVTDASFRTHLFRLEHVPLRHLVPIAQQFFRSECLVSEWLDDQFKGAAEASQRLP